MDANGNVARLPIQLYFTNIMIAMHSMGKENYKIDVVDYTVNNMDPDVKAEIESTYTGHLAVRARDPVTQTRALQALFVAASTTETKVINTRNLMSSKTTALLIATVPGYTASVAGVETPAIKSVAERTIQKNIPIPPFEWQWGACVACGSETHKYRNRKVILCPHKDRSNAKANTKENFAKMRAERVKGKGKKDEAPTGKNKWDKPKWDKMGKRAKRHFAKTLLADAKNSDDFNEYITAAKEEDEDGDEPVLKKTCNVAIFLSIAILNGQAGATPPLPVKLDGDLPHMCFVVGDFASNNLETMLMARMDTGAGATI